MTTYDRRDLLPLSVLSGYGTRTPLPRMNKVVFIYTYIHVLYVKRIYNTAFTAYSARAVNALLYVHVHSVRVCDCIC